MQTFVFLLDVDNTLLNNDAIKEDWNKQLLVMLGPKLTTSFWNIYEQVRKERGIVDIPLALTRLREQTPSAELDETTYQQVLAIFEHYPFDKRLYPGAIKTLEYLSTMGCTVIVSDGDPAFQAMKIIKSGLAEAVEGRVLIFTHKQEYLDEIMQTYPADHYAMVDDHPKILHACKQILRNRLTTIFVRQGHYATDRLPEGFVPDLTVAHIGDLRNYRKEQLLTAERRS